MHPPETKCPCKPITPAAAAFVNRYGGGRANLSDTMAGTLWISDALFAFANAGARAFHLHWGYGGVPFDGGAPNVGVQTNFDYNVSSWARDCSWKALFRLLWYLSTQSRLLGN
eukprot:GHUV01023362.1.p1 GENE.GHUV01023362.1~~GHUV01023362.1.p1  ORF type:complete len:113 (-),score=15.11 GHUV01023362.1:293-631(-)